MSLVASVASFVVIFLLMIGLVLWLRFRGVLNPAQGPVVSRVITEGLLPAMIFCYVARAREEPSYLAAAAVIAVAEAIACGASAAIGRYLLRMERRSLGSFVLASSFGSTSLIGNAMLEVVFHGKTAVLGMGMVIGQFGVGVPNNTIGLWIGMISGDRAATPGARPSGLSILWSPVVIALLAGVGWSLLGIPSTTPGIATVFGALTLVAAALPFLAAVVTGLSLAPLDWRRLAPAILCSQALMLLAKPLLVWWVLSLTGIRTFDQEVTLLLAALPASPLAVAFASRFGGDAELATGLVVSSALLSVATLPLVSWLS
ncbi:MAG: hypothetical protein JSS43_34220 [Proteobacteria bacterium]|nr:hypothetical protein [Pseudomonadota bacterium]